MGLNLTLTAADGHSFNVYRSNPATPPHGAVILVQEIFGVTAHIRAVADGYARAGYVALAPYFYDRIRPGIELSAKEFDEARSCAGKLQDPTTFADLAATVDFARQFGRVAVIGYCWGGTVAHVAACRLPIQAAVSYYGTRTLQYLNEKAHAPVLHHFGERDTFITAEHIAQIKTANPQAEYHVYAGAEHAFNNDTRPDKYHAESAQLALQRTLDFLHRHLG